MKLSDTNYYRTIEGKFTRIYAHQRYNSKHKRDQAYPEYSKVELIAWAKSQGTFYDIWNAWVASNYTMALSPSVDRIDKTKHYFIGNIQLMTWAENNAKGNIEHRGSGQLVHQYHRDGGYIDTYISYYDAAKQTKVPSANIREACLGERKQAGNYLWSLGDTNPNLFEKVRMWSRTRGLTEHGDAKTQTLKVMEELGELSRAILKLDGAELTDALGDTLVTLVVLGDILDINIEECWSEAIDVIGQRSGKMTNGTFIKSTDANYEQLLIDFKGL